MNLIKKKKIEKIFKEIDESKEKLFESETELEENFWKAYKSLCELELAFVYLD